MKIVILSKGRAGRVSTVKWVDYDFMLVPEDQIPQYSKHYPAKKLLGQPASVRGLPACRQFLYEKFGDLFMIDDDVIAIMKLFIPAGSPYRRKCYPEEFRQIIMDTAELARQLGAYLFGFNNHCHPLSYQENHPIRFGGYICGGGIGILKGSKLSWPTDTVLPIDDYWINCLNLYHHRYSLINKNYGMGFGATFTGRGGLEREKDSEQKANDYLIKHFGTIIKPKTKNKIITKAERAFERRIDIPWPH